MADQGLLVADALDAIKNTIFKKERCRIAKDPKKHKAQIFGYQIKKMESDPMFYKWVKKKHQAKQSGAIFTIQPSDLPSPPPEFCPVLGLKLKYRTGPHDHGATIDRVNPNFGYVPGNVAIISNRANRIKAAQLRRN